MKASFECVDGHTAGMPVRMVVSGAPKLQGADQSERRQHFIQEFDWIRRALMFEPRGHSAKMNLGKMDVNTIDLEAITLLISG